MEEDSDLISSPSPAGKATSPSQPWNLQRSSSQMHAADGSGKRRGGEAAANLEGMRRLLEQASGSLQGEKATQSRVLTRAPAFDPQLHKCRQPASSQIKPHTRYKLTMVQALDPAIDPLSSCQNMCAHLFC